MNRNAKYGLLGVIALGILYSILHFFGLLGPAKAGNGNDSPIEVVGGSIFLEWEPGYQPTNNNNMISGQSDDTRELDFNNLNLAKTAAPYGWRIHVMDPHGEAVKVCSDPACAPSAGDHKTYYVTLRSHEMVDPHAPPSIPKATNEMHFHDDYYCQTGGTEDRTCDRAVYFTVDLGTANGTWVNGSQVSCADNPTGDRNKRCRVLIGTVK
jgi:hypothetical protein